MRECGVGDWAVLDSSPGEVLCGGAHGTVGVSWPDWLVGGCCWFDGLDS